MGKWTKTTAGLIFLAAASVYADREIAASVRNAAKVAGPEHSAVAITSGKASQAARSFASAQPVKAAAAPLKVIAAADNSTDVKLLDDSSDPFASSPATTQPTAATTQPASEGKSVSSQEVSVSDAGTVEIHVNDANLVEVLRMLSLQSQKNIIASKEVHGTVTANLYDVTVREALDAILHANGYAYREKGNFIYVYTAKELEEIAKAERQMKTEVFRVYYTPAANAATMIKPVLSASGQVAVTTPATVGLSSGGDSSGGGSSGGSSGSSSGGSAGSGSGGGDGGNTHATEDMLVVTDYPENLDAVKHVLSEVDQRPQQILLEATILRAELNEDNALGIDFTVLGGVDFAGLNTAGSSAGEVLSGAIANNPAAQGVVKNNAAAGQTGFTGGLPTGGMRIGVVTSNVAAFLQALEQTTDTAVLANPKILTLNKQQGEVFVGNEDGYYTTVTTETTTSQQVDTLKTGTRLLFRPYIASDGYIRLDVHPEDSDGQVKANGLPSKTTTEVTSNIMVKDGHTVVIGGLFRESSVTSRSQVPFLGNIPVAGLLFKNQRDRTVRDEVIILLTPHIVKDQSVYDSVSAEQMQHMEDMRVGVRKGMMPWGRTRLAESAYEEARKEMAKPHPDRHLAIWHLNEATNLNPEFTEAIEMKQALTGRVVTEANGTSIRDFVKNLIIRDVPPATNPSTQPADVSMSEPQEEHHVPTTLPTAAVPTTQPTVSDATTQPSDESARGDGETSDDTSAADSNANGEKMADSDSQSADSQSANSDSESADSDTQSVDSKVNSQSATSDTQSADSESESADSDSQPADSEPVANAVPAPATQSATTQPVVQSDKNDSEESTPVTAVPLDPAAPETDEDSQK